MNQKDFADCVDCSESTLQAVERGPERLKLSNDLAMKIFAATGVSIEWLNANDLSRQPEGRFGVPYTRQYYDEWRAAMEKPRSAFAVGCIPRDLFGYYELARRVLDTTDREKEVLALYRLSEFFKDFVREFTGHKIPSAIWTTNDTLTLVEKDLKTTKRLWKFLRGKSGYVSDLPQVKNIAAELERNLKETKSSQFPIAKHK